MPIHKKGEAATVLIKLNTSAGVVTLKPVTGRVLFLKQNCMKVSRISDRIRNSNIFNVSLFLNIYLVL